MDWTAAELATFLTGMPGHRHHRTYWLAAYTGLRRSELLGLQWRDVDLDDDTVNLLARWRSVHTDRFGDDPGRGLIVRDDGELVNPQTISQSFERAVARTDLPKISLHGLRHTHPTLLLKAGVPLKVVSERLGHCTPAFTMATCQHVLPGVQAEAAARFANLLDGAA